MYSCYVEIVAIFLNCMYVVPMMLQICLLHVLVSMLQVTCTTHKSHRKDHHSTSHVKAVEKKHLYLNSVLALLLPCILFPPFSKIENCDIYPRIWKHLCTPKPCKACCTPDLLTLYLSQPCKALFAPDLVKLTLQGGW